MSSQKGKRSTVLAQLQELRERAISALADEDAASAKGIDVDKFSELLAQTDTNTDSIFREECLSLLCELRDDFPGAIAHRQREISLLRDLLESGDRLGNMPAVAEFYDYSDLGDRLDWLAILLHDTGMLDEAVFLLLESKALAEKGAFPFESEELLADYQKERLEKWDPLESTCRHASLSIL